LRLFADMGRVGQVIYFTHHQHLAELAKRCARKRGCTNWRRDAATASDWAPQRLSRLREANESDGDR
jgi:hypothetical protein